MGDTRVGATYGSHKGIETSPTSTDGQSGEGSDGRSGVGMELNELREE